MANPIANGISIAQAHDRHDASASRDVGRGGPPSISIFGTLIVVRAPFLDTLFSALYPYVLLPERLSSLCALPRAFAVI